MDEEIKDTTIKETIITITFNDCSVYVAKNVTEFHIDDQVLYFRTQPNAIPADKTYCVPIGAMKMYEIEKVK